MDVPSLPLKVGSTLPDIQVVPSIHIEKTTATGCLRCTDERNTTYREFVV